MEDQKRLTCQKHKVKERNVANNYEKSNFYGAFLSLKLKKREKNLVKM